MLTCGIAKRCLAPSLVRPCFSKLRVGQPRARHNGRVLVQRWVLKATLQKGTVQLQSANAEEIATYIQGLSASQDRVLKAHQQVELVREQALAVKELHLRALEELKAAKAQALAAASQAGDIGKAHREALQEVIALGNVAAKSPALMEQLQRRAYSLAQDFQLQMDAVRLAHSHVVECEAVVAKTEGLLKTANSKVAAAASLENDAMEALLHNRGVLEKLVQTLVPFGQENTETSDLAVSGLGSSDLGTSGLEALNPTSSALDVSQRAKIAPKSSNLKSAEVSPTGRKLPDGQAAEVAPPVVQTLGAKAVEVISAPVNLPEAKSSGVSSQGTTPKQVSETKTLAGSGILDECLTLEKTLALDHTLTLDETTNASEPLISKIQEKGTLDKGPANKAKGESAEIMERPGASAKEVAVATAPFPVEPLHIHLDKGLTPEQILAQLREELWQIWQEEPDFVREVYADSRTCLLKDAYHRARAKLQEATLDVATLEAKMLHQQELASKASTSLDRDRLELQVVTAQVEDAFRMKDYWNSAVKALTDRLDLIVKAAIQEQMDDVPAGTQPGPVEHHPAVVAASLERDAAHLELTMVESCLQDLLDQVRELYAQSERDADASRAAAGLAAAASKAYHKAMWHELETAFEVVERQHQLERVRQVVGVQA